MGVLRFFYTSSYFQNINKSALAALRKKTGYTFANCRKALELHNNDATKAEQWLNEQAKLLGWQTAMKVQNRRATQGLIGIATSNKKIAMVEVNCETDFVARNTKFLSMVETVTQACLKYPVLKNGEDTNKIILNSNQLGELKAGQDSLSDQLALLIGSVGENMTLRRAFCYETIREDISVAVSVHPSCSNPKFLYGKYGSFISYIKNDSVDLLKNMQQTFNDELCKHIIGFNPSKIGNYEEDKPNPNDDEESILIYQPLLSDDSITVGEYLKSSGITLLDFNRFECGELAPENEYVEVESKGTELNEVKI